VEDLEESSVIYHHAMYILDLRQRDAEGGCHVGGVGVESAIKCDG
jgi:hypothetical protein